LNNEVVQKNTEINSLTVQKNDLANQVNANTLTINSLAIDKSSLLFDNNKYQYDINKLRLDGNYRIDVANDMNSRGHRLYIAFDNCYWAAKCADVNNTQCALKYAYIDLNTISGTSASGFIQAGNVRNAWSGYTDANIGDYNYFK
jgi:hypothetical protein